MGFLGMFNKKEKNLNKDFNKDSLGSDPFMDTDSGLNLPKDDNYQPQFNEQPKTGNPYLDGPNDFDQGNPHLSKRPTSLLNETHNQQFNQQPNQQPQQQEQPQNKDISKDLEIIIAKLDALRAEVHSLNHRMENLEKRQQKKMW